MLDIELMLACLTLCYSDVTGAHHRPPIWSGDRGEELLTLLAIMDYPTSFMKKWGKKDHLKHCSFFKEKAAIEVYLVVLKRDRIAFRGKNFYIKGKSTFRAFCKIEEPAAVCISPAPHSILVSSYNISTQVFRRWCWSACFLSYYSSSALTLFENYSNCHIWMLAFSNNFCPIKTGNTVWPQASSFQKVPKMDHFWHFLLTFVHSKCKCSSLRSQCWVRLFLWFSNTVYLQKVRFLDNLIDQIFHSER